MATNKNYIKGLFMTTKETQYGPIGSLCLTDEAIEQINKLPKSPKGYRNLSWAAQKNEPAKFSVWENTFVPKNANAPAVNSVSDDTDDLPF